METRAAIETVLDKLYDARRRNDPTAAADCFHENGRFRPNGAPAVTTNRIEQVAALKGLFEAFVVEDLKVHCRVIDPPRAVVHWRGTFRTPNGKQGDADILDIIEFRDGKAASLTTFFDTAYAAALSAPA
jgi:ketosteroid isomerase-like protein